MFAYALPRQEGCKGSVTSIQTEGRAFARSIAFLITELVNASICASVGVAPTFAASFTYGTEGTTQTTQGNITVKGQKYRLKTSGQEIYNNGKEVSTYIKETNEVNISDYEPSENDLNPAKVYSFDKKGFRYVFIQELKEGADTYEVIELSPETYLGQAK